MELLELYLHSAPLEFIPSSDESRALQFLGVHEPGPGSLQVSGALLKGHSGNAGEAACSAIWGFLTLVSIKHLSKWARPGMIHHREE